MVSGNGMKTLSRGVEMEWLPTADEGRLASPANLDSLGRAVPGEAVAASRGGLEPWTVRLPRRDWLWELGPS